MPNVFLDIVKSFFVVGGIVIFLFGLGFLFDPNLLKKVDNWFNFVVFQDELIFRYRLVAGIIFIVVALGIFYLIYYKSIFSSLAILFY